MESVFVVGAIVLIVALSIRIIGRIMGATFGLDREVEEAKKRYLENLIVEPLKTKINRHRGFWVGRSKRSNGLRIGIEYAPGGRRYFFDEDDFWRNERHQEFRVMTPLEADSLEAEIKAQRKKK